MLGTTRQAAFQRFGRPVDPRTGLAMNRALPPGAADRAVAVLAAHDERRWAEIIEQLDETMRGLHSPEPGFGYGPQTWQGFLVTVVLVLFAAGTAAATGGHSPLMVLPIAAAILVPLIIIRIQRR